MAMTREQMQSCMEQVAQYRASGQKAQAWADAHGLSRQTLVAWCTHVQRWQARLDGVSVKPTTTAKPSGFVAARVAPGTASSSVRLELNAGGTRIDLHWPLTHTRELATLVRELNR